MKYIVKLKAKTYNEIRVEIENRISRKFPKVFWYIESVEELNGKETGWFKVTTLVMEL